MINFLTFLQKHALVSYITVSNIILLTVMVIGFSTVTKGQAKILSDAYDNQALVRDEVDGVHRDVIQKIELHCDFQEKSDPSLIYPMMEKVPNMICVQDPKKLM